MKKRELLKFCQYNSFGNISELIQYAASKHHEKTAVSYFSNKTDVVDKTYDELHSDIMKLAFYIRSKDLSFKPIGLIGDCSYEWIVSFFAIIWAGSYPVLIDNALSAEDTMNLLKSGDVKNVILECKKSNKELIDQVKKQMFIIGLRNNGPECDDVYDFVEMLIQNESNKLENYVEVNPEDLALIVFTSGTTGNNKAVMLSHRNICADIDVSYYYMPGKGKQTAIFAVLPVFHMLQITTGILTPIYVGAKICIGRGKRYIVQGINRYQPSILVLVPSVVEMFRKKIWAEARLNGKEKKLLNSMKLSNALLSIGIDVRKKMFADIHKSLGGNLDNIICGGAPISIETVKEFRTWGIDVWNGYGITECSPVVVCDVEGHNKDGSIGYVGEDEMCTYRKVQIIDGEVCVKGDIVMKGYYNNENATQEAFCDGYFKTGDLGIIDEEGFLFITGRKKNLIILENGENISPEELEGIFSKIEGVKNLLVHSKKVGHGNILSAIVVPTGYLTASA